MKRILILLYVAGILFACVLVAEKLVPKYLLVNGTDIKLTQIRMNNGSIDISVNMRGTHVYRGELLAQIVDNLNISKNIGCFNDIENIYFFNSGWNSLNLTVSLCYIDSKYYIESIVATDDGILLPFESLEYMDLSHLRILQSCSIPPASKGQTKKIAEYAPNLEILSLSPHIPFLEYDENAIVFLLSELEGIRSFEFIDDEKMESIFYDIPYPPTTPTTRHRRKNMVK